MSNQALSNALLVLGRFDALRPEWSVTGLSESTGLEKSHVSKILKEFRQRGFLVQDPLSRRYRVGPQALTLGAGYHAASGFVKRADVFMRRLVQDTGATATLNVIDGQGVLFVAAKDDGQRPLFSWPVGSYIPLHATAAGKVAAAFAPRLSAPALEAERLRTFTPATICRRSVLKHQLAEIRRAGLAFTFGESTYGLAAVAAPILDENDNVAGAISLLCTLARLRDADSRRALAAAVSDTAGALSRAIGATRYPDGAGASAA
jgi:IclR family acetate operon transcriptional repressor